VISVPTVEIVEGPGSLLVKASRERDGHGCPATIQPVI
jgi:hypothetical protein